MPGFFQPHGEILLDATKLVDTLSGVAALETSHVSPVVTFSHRFAKPICRFLRINMGLASSKGN